MTTNGNGKVFRWIAGSLLSALLVLVTALITMSASGVNAVKVDAANERLRIEARLDANTAQDRGVRDAVTRMETDIAWIRRAIEEMRKEKP